MSFRTRLTLFFVLIVIVPMISLALVLFRLIADSEAGKADARVAAQQETAVRLFGEARARGATGVRRVGADVSLATALQRGRAAQARRRATVLLGSLGLKRIVIARGQRTRLDVGSRTAVFPARAPLQDAKGRSFGTLAVSAQGPRAYADAVKRLAGVDVVLRRQGRTLAATLPAARTLRLPAARGDLDVKGRRYRASGFTVRDFLAGAGVRVTVLSSAAGRSSDVSRSRAIAGAILLGFFGLAFAFAVLVSRGLQQQIASFLDAARRLGRGDFTARVRTTGQDEFALLGEEFNRMAAELEARLEELRAEQARVAVAMRRTGQTFAANLDREGLLDIVVRTAVDGAGAEGGRARVGSAPGLVTAVGELDPYDEVLAAAEREALRTGGPAGVEREGRSALAHPLQGTGKASRDRETGPARAPLGGVLAIARADRPFAPTERDLFAYLARQAAVSLENVGLHETVERQAVTDALTGLANRRRFEEALESEVERSKRFDAPVALVMLDIDNFKSVNDTHGHQTGDQVLREVARLLLECSREVDEPARYGGEELAVVLPGTDLEGAYNLAERVRTAIEGLRLELSGGDVLQITASFGAATLPRSGDTPLGLVEAADAALYEAKRSGKNRTVRADAVGLG